MTYRGGRVYDGQPEPARRGPTEAEREKLAALRDTTLRASPSPAWAFALAAKAARGEPVSTAALSMARTVVAEQQARRDMLNALAQRVNAIPAPAEDPTIPDYWEPPNDDDDEAHRAA